MLSTHFSLHYDIVFSRKERIPSFATAWRERLHPYLAGVFRNASGVPEAVSAVAAHVHLLVRAAQRDAIRESISRHEEHHHARAFQEEYLALLRRSGVDYDDRYLW